MSKEEKPKQPIRFIRALMKGRTEAEIKEAEQNFLNYLLIVEKICNRLEREGKIPKRVDKSYKTEQD